MKYVSYSTRAAWKRSGRPGNLTRYGYVTLQVDGYTKMEHVVLAEKALGRPLPPGAEVHHLNGIPWDNHRWGNLVICPDREYHMLLHMRMRELAVQQIMGGLEEEELL